MNDWILLLIGLLLTFGTGIFVAAEFSLVALDRQDLERRRESGERGLDRVIRGLSRTSTHLSSAQLGITLTTLLAGYTLEPAISGFLDAPLGALGVPEDLRRTISAPIAIALATVFSMIVGELVPKNFALARPLATAKFVMPAQGAFTATFKPAVVVLNGSANGMLRGIGIEPKEELSGARSAEELSSLVRHSASAGLLEADTATLLGRTLRFSELTAADVMTPRLKIESVQRLEPAQAVLELSGRSGYSRFPVIDEDRDDIVGVVHVKHAVAVPRAKRGEVPVAAIAEEVVRIPDTMRLDQLLGALRTSGFQLAIVVDEYGGTAGIVTLEDLVEEIVGEVADEHDRAAAGVVGTAEEMTFPADLRPDEVRDQTGVEIPEDDDYDTVAGFVLRELGRIPEPGDEVTLADGGTLRVERMEGRRIARLRYTGVPMPTDSADQSEEAAR
ncbi:hemolysin family protein [Leucobacter luti]|uniref:CBS domain containing-hemolysin-like protein n=1 Tax=Leucobacter luti TaxID=340320 RepID=A0A4R6S443_9MICO|nr:hemolysin family protein [Leucobacter luti]QYM76717.1 hemolysin family protein [Leucobacter luti]TDP94401.1 CBS domain containing-hemolysin-like protein [Leucobacter luti]